MISPTANHQPLTTKLAFSIIIPVYNVAPYLRACLDSVLAQTYDSWEAICVDDGSTDGSGAILDEYAAKEPRFKVIHQANGGMSSARNAGIEVCKGEWLLFLDSDDLLGTDTLERIVGGIASYPQVDLFRFGYFPFDDGLVCDLPRCVAQSTDARLVDITTDIRFEDIFVYMWQFAYRRTMVGDLRFDPTYHRMEDRPFICDCLLNRNRFFVDIGYHCLWYRQRAGSATHIAPTTHVWDGEIRYRIELIRMLDASGKTCDGFVQSDWIGGFFQYFGLQGIFGRSAGDVENLMAQWQLAIRFLRRRREIRWSWRVTYWICSWTNSIGWSALMIAPIQYIRRDAPAFKPITRAYRKLMRHGEFSTAESKPEHQYGQVT